MKLLYNLYVLQYHNILLNMNLNLHYYHGYKLYILVYEKGDEIIIMEENYYFYLLFL